MRREKERKDWPDCQTASVVFEGANGHPGRGTFPVCSESASAPSEEYVKSAFPSPATIVDGIIRESFEKNAGMIFNSTPPPPPRQTLLQKKPSQIPYLFQLVRNWVECEDATILWHRNDAKIFGKKEKKTKNSSLATTTSGSEAKLIRLIPLVMSSSLFSEFTPSKTSDTPAKETAGLSLLRLPNKAKWS